MADNFGREELWTPEIWAEIDKAVMAEIGRQRVAQKVLVARQMPNAPNVSADIFNAQAMTIQEGITLPFMEISAEFALTQGQKDNEATLRTGRTVAQLAARSVALTEDLLFFQGAQAQVPAGVQVTNRPLGNGLIDLPGALPPIQVPPSAGGGYGLHTFTAITQGIAALTGAGYPGPYALVLEATIFADTYAAVPVQNPQVITADRVSPLVEGRFYSAGTLPVSRGLLVSLGGDPTTIYVAQDAITAYTQKDQQGNYRFRVFERVQIVAREPQACLRLEFQAAQAQPAARRGGRR